jgi:hypothetical protein
MRRRNRIAQCATEAPCVERKEQMFYNIFTGSMETEAPDELTCADVVFLSEVERISLQLFVMGLGKRIDEDTSLFTSTERKRLEFVQWLYTHGKLLQ